MARTARKIKFGRSDRIFYTATYILLTVFTILVLYPLLYILAASFSSPQAVTEGRVFIIPVDPSLEGYTAVFKNELIMTGFANSIFYVIAGTIINMLLTIMAAYPLSRRDLVGRSFFTFFFAFTMMFGGGLIPSYILIKNLSLIGTRWALIIPGGMSVYNMIICRTYIQSNIPSDLLEVSKIEGASNLYFLWKVVLPLSKPVLAVLVLFYAVGHWNSWFGAFLYLNDSTKYPLQLVLRNILISNTVNLEMVVDYELLQEKQRVANLLKFSLIVVSTVPVLMIYPFVQKYFVQGIMIGSLKG